MIRIAINGFGRIGRRVFRLLQNHNNIEVVAINDLADTKTLSHLLKYDSVHGVFNGTISSDKNHIIVNNKTVTILNESHPNSINWTPFNIDFVIEATGKFKTITELQLHIKNGAKRVILSVPPIEDDIKTIVLGVNGDNITGAENIISNASCTTNNAAPIIDIINKLCGINQAYITTVHSYKQIKINGRWMLGASCERCSGTP